MSTFRNPVGPQPPAVYWRRRLILGLGLLAVIVVVVLIIVRPGAGEEKTPNVDPSASTQPSDEPDPSPSFTGDAKSCDPSVVALTAVTDADSYSAEQQPMISMKITNTGAAPCSYDVGTGAQEYLIMSGSDRIWSSKDCQTSPTEDVRVLEPGVELSTTAFPWDRTRSATDTCEQSRPAVIAGGATYRLTVKLGEAESKDTPFLLN